MQPLPAAAVHPFDTVEKPGSFPYNSAMQYKVIEISTVTDEEIERVLNEWTAKGYAFASIHFVMTEASRRPAMAFLFFTEQGTGHAAAPFEGPAE
jgi:hypothetical protein